MKHLTDFQVISSLTGAKEDASKELLRSAGSLNGVFRMAHEELTKYLTKGQAQKVLAAKEIVKGNQGRRFFHYKLNHLILLQCT